MACLKDMSIRDVFKIKDDIYLVLEWGKIAEIPIKTILSKCLAGIELSIEHMFTTREEAEAKLKELNND